MPVLFIFVGTVLIVSSLHGTSSDLVALLKSDFSGKDNFVYFFVAVILIGSIGYIKPLKSVSTSLLALVLLVIFLKNGGVWQKLTDALNGETKTSVIPAYQSSAPVASQTDAPQPM